MAKPHITIIASKVRHLELELSKLKTRMDKQELRHKQVMVLLKAILTRYQKRYQRKRNKYVTVHDLVSFIEDVVLEHKQDEEEKVDLFEDMIGKEEVQDDKIRKP